MSLADKLESLHRDSGEGEASAPGDTAAPPPAHHDSPSTDTPRPPRADTNGGPAGAGSAPKVVLGNLPQLQKRTPVLGAGPRIPVTATAAAAPVKNGSPGARARGAHRDRAPPVTATVSLETHGSRATQLEAVQATAKATGVQIEVTKGGLGYTTFMLKGAPDAVERAKPVLAAWLAPRVTRTVRIPAAARSALIGARGSNLRRLSAATHCRIDVSNVASPWSLDLASVEIEGTEDGVGSAADEVVNTIDKTRTFSAARAVPPLLVRFLAAEPALPGTVSERRARVAVQGGFDAVLAAMARIDALVERWSVEFALQPLALSGAASSASTGTLAEDLVFAEHGVVITPEGELYGPAGQLSAAAAAVEAYAASLARVQLDIAQAHNRNEAHARMLTRYLAASSTVADIARTHGVRIVDPEAGTSVYELVGRDADVQQARKALVAIVNARSPASMAVVRGMRSAAVRAKAADVSRSLSGNVKPVLGPSDELYLVFEDPGDDFAPTDDEIRAAVAAALAKYAGVVELAQKVVTKSVTLDDDAKYVAAPLGDDAQQLYKQVIGAESGVHCTVSGPTAVLSGLREPVAAAVAALPQIVALSKQHAVRASFTQEVQFEQALLRNLIGRSGAQIQAYRDEFGVSVEADDNGRVIIQGLEPQAKAAAKAIAELQRRLRDEHTERLAIPAQYHVKLIGPKGKHVRRLSEQHDVTIRFPRRSAADEPAAEARDAPRGESRGESPDADADIIVIRGPSKGVAAVKREFLDLVAYEKAQSHSQTVKISAKLMPRIVGRQGIAINAIKHESGAQIDIGKEADSNDEVAVVVTGEQKRVAAALALIKKAASDLEDQTDRTIDIDPQYHRLLTGPGNSIRRQIVAEAGGETEPLNQRTLNIPPSHTNSSTIKMSGPSKVVDAMEAIIRRIVEDEQRKSQASATIHVAPSRHRLLVGPQGRVKRTVEEKFRVQVTVPRAQESDAVTIRGETQADVDAAAAHLQALAAVVQDSTGVPSPLWHARLKRTVFDKFGVKADGRFHAASVPKPDDGYTSQPLASSARTQVKLTGKTSEDVAKAKAFLAELSNKSDTVGYLWLDNQQIRKAVGPGGQNVNSARASTGSLITVPDDGNGAPVVIVGEESGVEAARQALLKFCA